jgi:hypothetical protein
MTANIMRLSRRLHAETEASEIAEAALVLPLLFTFLLAIISFGRAYNIYTTLTYAAHEGARVANSTTCAMCGNTPATAVLVASTVGQVLQASKIDPNPIQIYTGTSALNACPGGGAVSCNDSNNVHVCTNVELNATTRRRRFGPPPPPTVTGPVACGTTVSFQYPYQLNLPFSSWNKQLLALKVESQLVSEN